jgi:hypothetical protein
LRDRNKDKEGHGGKNKDVEGHGGKNKDMEGKMRTDERRTLKDVVSNLKTSRAFLTS